VREPRAFEVPGPELRELFLGALDEPRRLRLAEVVDLDTLLSERVCEARDRWTSFAVTTEAFLAYVAARQPNEPSAETLRAMRWSELYLACACVAGDARAIAAFDSGYVAGIGAGL